MPKNETDYLVITEVVDPLTDLPTGELQVIWYVDDGTSPRWIHRVAVGEQEPIKELVNDKWKGPKITEGLELVLPDSIAGQLPKVLTNKERLEIASEQLGIEELKVPNRETRRAMEEADEFFKQAFARAGPRCSTGRAQKDC